jgi:hypothetical protein
MSTQVVNRRLVRDAALTLTLALPAASGTNAPSGAKSIPIGYGPFHPDAIAFEIAFPACAANTSTSDTYTFSVYDSADNSNFAAIVPAQSIAVAGVASTGSAAVVYTIHLPPSARAYIALNIVATSGTGNNTAQNIIFTLLS